MDRTAKTIVSNLGTTLLGTICHRSGHHKVQMDEYFVTERYFIDVNGPSMVEEVFGLFVVTLAFVIHYNHMLLTIHFNHYLYSPFFC